MGLLNGFIRVEQQQQQQYRKWSGGKCKFRLRKRPCQIRWGVTAYPIPPRGERSDTPKDTYSKTH